MKTIERFIISEDTAIRAAVKKMDEGGLDFVACVTGRGSVTGIMTAGDFRRAVLLGVDLTDPVKGIMNKGFYSLRPNYKREEARRIFLKTPAVKIPILKDNRLVDIITKEEFFSREKKRSFIDERINVPVVIMAGGKGTRMDPFTRVLPKPLVPIGDKPIIQIIMDNFSEFGAPAFYISVSHKAKMIQAYFEDFKTKYNISYVEEERMLGTAGALKLLEERIKTTFFVSNCDVLINSNIPQLYNFHKENRHVLTLVASMQHHVIPYGVCEIEKEGVLRKINEKPVYDLLVNTGIYVCEPQVLKFIPRNKTFHMTDLIHSLKKKNLKTGVFPISQKSWIDIGQWEEYKRAIKVMGLSDD